MKLLVLISVLCLLPYMGQALITLPKIIKSGMVLQQEPALAQVWGWTDDAATPISANVMCDTGYAGGGPGTVADGKFTIPFGPVPEGEICTITINQGAEMVAISNVLFGDIYVCSGQSNMEWGMGSILDSANEIAASAGYTNIRMYRVNYMTSATEQEDLMSESWDSWSNPSDAGRLSQFSAVCFLYAREISERFPNKPFGLIGSNWGGTRIEPWSPPEALANCGITPNVNAGTPQESDIYLYNAMIHPLIKMTIKGALWYQGESNAGWNRDLYPCTFSEMINTWRTRWAMNSGTDPLFPFGFAQLASWRENYGGTEYPIIRMHQSMGVGTVPHDQMQNVFMAVTLDTHDPESGIHPRNKQTVGYRLAIAGLNVAYGQTQYPSNGPHFTQIIANAAAADVTYDREMAFNPVETSGFYACVQAAGFDQCDNVGGSWTLIDASQVSQTSPTEIHVMLPAGTVGLAYLWNESPILGPSMAAPIYASDAYQLPAGPWKAAVN